MKIMDQAWAILRVPAQKLLMSKSTIEPNGLHYPDMIGEWKDGSKWVTPSDCFFAGCVPNMPCRVEAYEKHCASTSHTVYEDDLDLDY